MSRPMMIHPAARLKDLPPIEWLVENFIPKGALVTMFGAPGLGKSFLALDACMSVALGVPWLGRYTVEPGHAVYLPFEGVAGMGQRIRAWETFRGMETALDRFWYSVDFETLQHPDPMNEFVKAIRETLPEPPKLVIVDTLSKAMMGAEENSARDANLAMGHLARLQAETGCAVVLIHHTGKMTDTERGSSAIRGACDTMLLLKRDDDALVLSVDKQRDGECAKPVTFWLTPVGESVVPTLSPSREANALSPQAKLLIDAYWAIRQGEAPVAVTAWRAECEARGINNVVFNRRLKDLVASGHFHREGEARPTYLPSEEVVTL